jgi:hypothetical protein
MSFRQKPEFKNQIIFIFLSIIKLIYIKKNKLKNIKDSIQVKKQIKYTEKFP